jgi:hypothetical protein
LGRLSSCRSRAYYIIKQTYEGYACQIVHEGKLIDAILVMSGVKQGCILPLAIFLMVMDEVMRKAIGGKREASTGASQSSWKTSTVWMIFVCYPTHFQKWKQN